MNKIFTFTSRNCNDFKEVTLIIDIGIYPAGTKFDRATFDVDWFVNLL